MDDLANKILGEIPEIDEYDTITDELFKSFEAKDKKQAASALKAFILKHSLEPDE